MRIHLYLPKGHFRDSLVALLRTLPNTMVECPLWDRFNHWMSEPHRPDLVIVDLDRVSQEQVERLGTCFPKIRVVGLVDRNWLHDLRILETVDEIMLKSISAGEFLDFVTEIKPEAFKSSSMKIFS
jgi:hypothetical protein